MVLFNGSFKSKTFKRKMPISVILPSDNLHFMSEDYDVAEKPYKTLYLLHGVFGDENDFTSHTRIQDIAEAYDLAVITPAAENRFYTGNYGNFVTEELINFTRDIFPLSTKKEDTFIGGFSMGGYGALRNGLIKNNLFSKIATISAALITDDFNNWSSNSYLGSYEFLESCFGDLNKVPNSDLDPKFLIENLINDNEDIPDILMICANDDFLLRQNDDFNNFLNENYIENTYRKYDGVHGHDFCSNHIEELVKWLVETK